ncbi:MAG: hypothetical protein IT580_00840 [Verrucomicrobiales bacterium]|nr:hypothetical protein [Verrucomicrobiales bacterium]
MIILPHDDSPGGKPVLEMPDALGPEATRVVWFVAHTKSRCEKKLTEYCARAGLESTLPLYQSVKKYRGKTLTFEKPLFPGYVFLRMSVMSRPKVMQSDYVANLLDVPCQEDFEEQLQAILQALGTDYEVRLAPTIQPGARVRIKTGPLRGLEGYVEQRKGMVEVHLRLDFISQAAAVKMDADLLELA